MTTRSLLFLVLLAACSKSSSKTDNAAPTAPGSAATPGSAAPAVAPAPTAAAECPAGEALIAKLAELFKVTPDGISNEGCTTGKFPTPGLYVTAYVMTDIGTLERASIIDAKGATIASVEHEISPGHADSSGTSGHRAVDFDKDGTDEIVYELSSDRRGYVQSDVVVVKVVKGTLETALTRTSSFDSGAAVEESEAETCDATWEIDANLAIVFTPKGKATGTNEETCVLAKETWTLGADGKFAKAAVPAKPKKA